MSKTTETKLPYLMEQLYTYSTDPIIFFNAKGKVIEMNPAAETIFSPQILKQIQISEENVFCLTCRGYTSEDELMSCFNCYLSGASTDQTSFQVFLENQHQKIVPYSASFQTIDKAHGTRVLMLRNLGEQLDTQERLYHNTMMKSTIKAQENERKLISRELHDSVAQE